MQILQGAAHRQEEARLRTLRSLEDSCIAGDLSAIRAVLSSMDASAATALVNHAASGRNTLLFKASEYGHRDVVAFLIENGADGRTHPVTKYSPLYIAAYNGKKEVSRVVNDNDEQHLFNIRRKCIDRVLLGTCLPIVH